MARWSKRTILILLLLLALVSITLRYPLIEHERYQTDSYFIHNLSGSIVTEGRAVWTYHFLSYVGYYPLSYPSGVPFLVAEFSMMSGLSIEGAILVLNIVTAVLFCLGVYLLSRHFVRKPEMCLLVTTLAILGSRFVDTSYWNGSARAPAVVFMVLAVVATLRFGSSWNLRFFVVCSMLVIASLAIHHMSVLLLLFGVAYAVTVFMAEYLPRKLRIRRRYHTVMIIMATSLVIILAPFLLFDYFWESALRGMQGSPLLDFEFEALRVFVVSITSYTNQIGFVTVFAVAYIWVLARKLDLNMVRLFPVLVIVVFIPILGEGLYVSMILSPFVAVLGVLWFEYALRVQSLRRTARTLLVILLAASLALPILSVNRWNNETFASGDRVLVDYQVFNDALYLDDLESPVFGMCNVIPVETRLGALSNVGFLGSGIRLALNGDVTHQDVLEGLQKSSQGFPKNIYNWYDFDQAPPVDRYVRNLMIGGFTYLFHMGKIDGATEYFTGHSRMIVVIDNRWTSSYLTTHSVFNAGLPDELLDSASFDRLTPRSEPIEISSYMYYQSGSVTAFLVQFPFMET